MSIVKMAVGGVHNLVDRAYRESSEHQYIRETYVNAVEAGATHIEFSPEWEGVEFKKVYRLSIADNGKGMTDEQLLAFLNTFGGGGKPIGDLHENYGVGSKTSLLPWNKDGVIVISWTPETPNGAMVRLEWDEEEGEYGAHQFETEEGEYSAVVEPHGEWENCKPSFIEDHGTLVICLGNTGTEDTFLGKDGTGEVKAITKYLNRRIWEIPDEVTVQVKELRSSDRDAWPRNHAEASGPQPKDGSKDRRWNRRTIEGAHHYVKKALESGGTSGSLLLSDGTNIRWFLGKADAPKTHAEAQRGGYVAALYNNELYDVKKHAAVFRSFGVTHKSVRQKLTIIAEPPGSNGSYGVYPDTARNALKLQGTKTAGAPLPWEEWAEEFARNMPAEIREALNNAGGERTSTLKDPSWAKRLIDKWGSRWKTFRFIVKSGGPDKTDPSLSGGGGRNCTKKQKPKKPSSTGGGNNPGDGDKVTAGLDDKGKTPAKKIHARGALPEIKWINDDDDYDVVQEGCAAAWVKNDGAAQNGCIYARRSFPAFVEVRDHWQAKYPDYMAETIQDIVEDVYGEALVARIAHSEMLASDPAWGRQRIELLRSDVALTMAVLGLVSEDARIQSRIAGKLGKAKAA